MDANLDTTSVQGKGYLQILTEKEQRERGMSPYSLCDYIEACGWPL